MLSFVNQESQGNIHSLEYHGDGIMVNDPSISFPSDHGSQYVFNENDHLSVNWENSMSEQDIREILLDAGYAFEEINDIISKARSNESACSEESSSVSSNMSLLDDMEDPLCVLKDLKAKNSDRPVIAHLNINSLSSKFEPLTDMVKDSIDFLLVCECVT